jgi:hypothetical protein
MYPEISSKDHYNEHIKDKFRSIDLDGIIKDELAARQRNLDTKKLVSLLSLFPEP